MESRSYHLACDVLTLQEICSYLTGTSSPPDGDGAAGGPPRPDDVSFSQGRGGVGSFSQSACASFSHGMGSGGASFSQGSCTGGAAAAFSQGGGDSGRGASLSQGRGASFSPDSGTGGAVAAFSQGGGGGSGGADFSEGRGGGGVAFSQGGGDGRASFSQGGGSGSLWHAQSQLSQASLNENLLSQAPAHDQRFSLQEESSKRTPSYPSSFASGVREDSQLQLRTIPTNPIHRWSPSLPDSRCQINEEVERKFQHLASSVHKMGMILDMYSFCSAGSIQKKFVLLEDSLKQILKGQDDLKALFEGSTESNPDQLSVLNSHTRKLDEMSSILSALPNHVQTEFGQLKGDTYRILTKEMEMHHAKTMQKHITNIANGATDQPEATKQELKSYGSNTSQHTPMAYLRYSQVSISQNKQVMLPPEAAVPKNTTTKGGCHGDSIPRPPDQFTHILPLHCASGLDREEEWAGAPPHSAQCAGEREGGQTLGTDGRIFSRPKAYVHSDKSLWALAWLDNAATLDRRC
ncbi:hypothetical protein ZWY2020_049553 [Hordeum vulgare]|nr:hypothetical protein ZWY2020_049553 [Hordeum vulgare]